MKELKKRSLKRGRKKSHAKRKPAGSAKASTRNSKPPVASRPAGEPTRKAMKKAGVQRPTRFSLKLAPGLDRIIGGSRTHDKARRRLADHVTFTVAPKTISGEPIQAQRYLAQNLDGFRPRPESEDLAVQHLERLGFEVIHRGEFGISACGAAELVADALKVELGIQARPRRTRLRGTRNFAICYETPAPDDLYVAPSESLSIKSSSDHIDHFVFMPPPHSSAVLSPVEPGHRYFGIDKASMRRLLNVPDGATGAGVSVGMVDTGFFEHPYYVANGLAYRPTPTPTVLDPQSDSEGHGTAMAYNTLAVAPASTLMGFKKIQQQPHVAIEEAARAGADIVTCSWGWSSEQRFPVVEATINSLITQGKIILFASGDGDRFWPASMPQVLAVGGVYADQQDQLEASNYASGFPSGYPDYNHRQVPDVCGLCGQSPMGIYIMLPCPPNCIIDKDYAGMSFPSHDETPAGDGWLCASGTSSATAQIAGVAALMIARARELGGPALTTDRFKAILQQTAIPVERGKNAQGVAAVGHPNVAVGFGLVNARAAVNSLP